MIKMTLQQKRLFNQWINDLGKKLEDYNKYKTYELEFWLAVCDKRTMGGKLLQSAFNLRKV